MDPNAPDRADPKGVRSWDAIVVYDEEENDQVVEYGLCVFRVF